MSFNALNLIHQAAQLADELWLREARSSPYPTITQRQAMVLHAVNEAYRAGRRITQVGAVSVTGIDRSTLSELIVRLEKRGWLTRHRSRADARAYDVRLTGDGEHALSAAAVITERVLRELRQRVAAFDQIRIVDLDGHDDDDVTPRAAATASGGRLSAAQSPEA